MTLSTALPFVAAAISFMLAILAWIREQRSVPVVALSLGLALFGTDSLLAGLGCVPDASSHAVAMHRLRLLPIAAIPVVWLLFSLTYSRGDHRLYVRHWKWIIVLIGAVPIATAATLQLAGSRWLLHSIHDEFSDAWAIAVGPGGVLILSLFVVGAVLVLMNLERTLRAATGTMRWRIKFMAVGVGVLFCVRIYTTTQALLYSSIDLSLPVLDAGALVVCLLLMFRGLRRSRLLKLDVYPSQTLLYHSVTATVAGIYLLAVGLLAKGATHFGVTRGFALNAFVLLMATIGLTVLLLSDRIRQGAKRFVSRHFGRPQYDYRQVWTAFSNCTASVVDARSLCRSLINMTSDTFEALGVTIWLLDDTTERLTLGASTSLSDGKSRSLLEENAGYRELIESIPRLPAVLDIDASSQPEHRKLGELAHVEFAGKGGHRLCVPLRTGGETLGLMMLSDRVQGLPFTQEELDLLATIGEQTAACLLSIRLATQLLSAKQLEAFQAMSAFFVHDLKNTSSALSLTLQNLPKHFNDPEFRNDALYAISGSVNRINELIARLTVLRKGLELERAHVDLNRVVEDVSDALAPSMQACITLSLDSPQPVHIDPEQMGKVLTNLLLNAREATEDNGQVWVGTGRTGQRAFVSVRDNGVGMSPEFMENDLFRPFKSTKRDGMGIGLFHSRTIVEAHGGRIEVTSRQGEGTTFRVVLPLDERSDAA